MTVTPSAAHAATSRAVSTLALVLAVLAIVVLGFVVPGLGIVIAGALALTAYRGERRLQIALLGLAVLVTVLAVVGWALVLWGETSIEIGDPVRVQP